MGSQRAADIIGSVTEAFDFRPLLDGAGLALGVANVVMQLSVPEVGYGVVESRVPSGQAMRRPFKRARTTFTYIAVALVGTDEDRAAYRAAVDRQHRQVRSTPESPVAYNAFDPELQRWVAACLYKGLRDVVEWVGIAQSPQDQQAMYEASKVLGTALQMRPESWPATVADFEVYWRSMVTSRVRIDEPVRAYLVDLMRLRNLPWPLRLFAPIHAFITTGWLPPEFREAMGLPWSPRDQRRFERLNRLISLVERPIPRRVRALAWLVWLWDFRLRRRLGLELV